MTEVIMEVHDKNEDAVRYTPMAAGFLSMFFSTLYSLQRSGLLPLESMNRSVQRHLDLIGGTASVIGITGLAVSLIIARRERESKMFKFGVVLVVFACLWSFLFQSL